MIALPVKKAEALPAQRRRLPKAIDPRAVLNARAAGRMSAGDAALAISKYVQQAFPPDRLATMLSEMAGATDLKYGKIGFYKTPNWNARKDAYDRALKAMVSLESAGLGKRPDSCPTKVTFNVVSSRDVHIAPTKTAPPDASPPAA
jgi:hypothetical protein